MRNRITVHPFGYKKQAKPSRLVASNAKDSKNPTQTITYKRQYTVPVIVEGKLVFHYETINGKKKKVPTVETFCNTFTKTIKHSSANRPAKGRTLAEMVYESAK